MIGIAIIISSISVIFIIKTFNNGNEPIQLEFTPNEMKSYPNHTVWLLSDIRTKSIDLMANLSILFKTNVSIDIEYKIWENSQLRKVD